MFYVLYFPSPERKFWSKTTTKEKHLYKSGLRWVQLKTYLQFTQFMLKLNVTFTFWF